MTIRSDNLDGYLGLLKPQPRHDSTLDYHRVIRAKSTSLQERAGIPGAPKPSSVRLRTLGGRAFPEIATIGLQRERILRWGEITRLYSASHDCNLKPKIDCRTVEEECTCSSQLVWWKMRPWSSGSWEILTLLAHLGDSLILEITTDIHSLTVMMSPLPSGRCTAVPPGRSSILSPQICEASASQVEAQSIKPV